MDYEYVELVALKQIYGDVFACEKELREFLEAEVGHPIATYVDELKGTIKIKGAHRALVENCGYGFCQKCLPQKLVLPGISSKPVSVCTSCYGMLSKKASATSNVRQEKSRAENNQDKWWGDDELPPPSMRHFLAGAKPVSSQQSHPQLEERLANLAGVPVDHIRNPKGILPEREPAITLSTTVHGTPRLRTEDPTLAKLEERVAALRGVPVEVIRNPRLMVVDDDEEEEELTDDAKELLTAAETHYKKSAISGNCSAPKQAIYYANDAFPRGALDVEEADSSSVRTSDSSVLQRVIQEAVDAPSVADTESLVSRGSRLNFADCVRKTMEDAEVAEREAAEFINRARMENPDASDGKVSDDRIPTEARNVSTRTPTSSPKKKPGFLARFFKSNSTNT
ncbi:60S ribosomal protein L49 [Aphelenchoides avenae]|nr:60S ribosomal protein L49 [Aphelenchus avenae]